MKALFVGGIKSGKSKNAERYTLQCSKAKPIYLATTECLDEEMQAKIAKHREERADDFITLEEPLKLSQAIMNTDAVVLVECMSMWINNMLYHNHTEQDIFDEVSTMMQLGRDIVFVLNDVGASVVSDNQLARKFVDINGRVSQMIAQDCDEVFHTIAGISRKIK